MSFEDEFDRKHSIHDYIKTDSSQRNCLCNMFCSKNNENQSIVSFYRDMLCRVYEIHAILLITMITSTKVKQLPSFKGI